MPSTFNGEVNTGQETEAWILGMKKYFQVHDYSRNMMASIAIFNFAGRESIWWDHLRNVKNIRERKISWKKFEMFFRKKYLSDRYYDDKIKEFHELKLGQLTMEEYANKFFELLRYVRFIRDDKVKIQCFLSGIP